MGNAKTFLEEKKKRDDKRKPKSLKMKKISKKKRVEVFSALSGEDKIDVMATSCAAHSSDKICDYCTEPYRDCVVQRVGHYQYCLKCRGVHNKRWILENFSSGKEYEDITSKIDENLSLEEYVEMSLDYLLEQKSMRKRTGKVVLKSLLLAIERKEREESKRKSILGFKYDF